MTESHHCDNHEDLNAGMNRGAKENNGLERPPWYTKEWPKDRCLFSYHPSLSNGKTTWVRPGEALSIGI